jgi:hypothetical protein
VIRRILFLLLSGLLMSVPGHAWHDRTHMAVVVDGENQLVAEIRARMKKYPIVIDQANFRNSLANQVALIATKSTALGYQLQEGGTPVMSNATAYEQLAQSAALLRAVLITLDVPVAE